ncbi:MAG: Rrf2 family transcriptional regulator, partial [Anaeroplasmataceae bacterium]|nr:Rrf2 family transcriptional regulator [Anaeroplasmataceae bacterium]
MQITSKFTIAVHTLLAIHTLGKEYKTTSEFIASSVNVNPVVIRRTLQNLKAAGLVEVKAGSGGANILKDLKDITLYDIYVAMECLEGGLFHFHENPNSLCPVGRNIHLVLDKHLSNAQAAMENELKSVTLADLAENL